jgi:hypothetical protein
LRPTIAARPRAGTSWSRRRRSPRVLIVALAAALAAQVSAVAPARALDQVVFSDSLSAAWADWSWGSAVNFGHQPAYQGSRSIGWRVLSPWAGLYLRAYQPVPTSSATSLRFALRTSDPTAQLSVRIYAGDQPAGRSRLLSEFGIPAMGSWKTYDIALSAFGVAGQAVSGVVLQDATGVASQHLVEIDELRLGSVAVSGPVEIRPGNSVANNTRGRPTRPELFNVDHSFRPYYDKINGDYVGTTEQILQWAARKWGFDRLGYPDLAKAMAVAESWWHQSAANPSGARGILQVHTGHWPDTDPAITSTAYNADYAMAVVRYLYDPGSWLRGGTTGNISNAVAAWECGCGYNGWAHYATQVLSYNVTKPWLRPGEPPEWF